MDGVDMVQTLKQMLKEIHAGTDPVVLKERFKETLGETSPADIGRAEEELVREGLPREELRRLCDVHLEVMRDSLDKEELDIPPGHPLHTFREEHRMILEFVQKLTDAVKELKAGGQSVQEKLPFLKHLAEHLMEIEKHNVREENVLFPYMERHGISEPPAVMWAEHSDLRAAKKELLDVINSAETMSRDEFLNKLEEVAGRVGEFLSSHIYKENNILYPMAWQAVSPEEWSEIRSQCDELGYCCFTPDLAKAVPESEGLRRTAPVQQTGQPIPGGSIQFPSGNFTEEELLGILNTLPIDVTFVDKNDVFRYFSETRDRAFPRARASIGRKVQQCHPQKSLHMVNQILEDFRHGRRDFVHFWIQMEGKLIYINYFAVHNEQGEYLGTLETTQDITGLQQIKGEKRLLDPEH